MNQIAINREYCDMKGKDEVLNFILDFLSHSKEENVENVLKDQFSNGYCYYFAVILRTAFNRGEVCWCSPYPHICWVDEDGVPYDIYGICTSEADEYIPVSFLRDTLQTFMHTDSSKAYITSQQEASYIMDVYKKHVPVKPIKVDVDCLGWDGNKATVISYFYQCPTCKQGKLIQDYPCKCGQMIDWSLDPKLEDLLKEIQEERCLKNDILYTFNGNL